MAGFIDIHTHILPGVDDGAIDLENAINLIQVAIDQGTESIVLTPHYRGIYKKNSPEFLKEEFDKLDRELVKRNLNIKLYLASEIHYEVDAPKLLYEGKILSINGGKYCLLEFSTHSSREQIERGVSEVIRYGFIPVIAHVERYEIMRKDKHLIDDVIEMGAYIQVNSSDILSRGSIKRFCLKLLKQNKVHVVGSDAHNLVDRKPVLKEAYEYVGKKYGYNYANEIFHDNAIKILQNNEL